MNWYMPPDPTHPGRAIGIFLLAAIVGGAFLLSDVGQRHEIARQASEIERLSNVCPATEAGEQLVSTVRPVCGGELDAMRCIYTSNSGYGRSMRSRPAVPGESS